MVEFIAPIVPLSSKIIEKLNYDTIFRGKSKIQWIFFPHFFIERFHAGDEVKNKHLTFSYKRQGILSGMLKTHKLTQKSRKNELD